MFFTDEVVEEDEDEEILKGLKPEVDIFLAYKDSWSNDKVGNELEGLTAFWDGDCCTSEEDQDGGIRTDRGRTEERVSLFLPRLFAECCSVMLIKIKKKN